MDQNSFNSLDEFLRICRKNSKFLSYVVDQLTPQLFHQFLQQLTTILSVQNVQTEAKNNCFFKRWNEIKIPIHLIDLNFVSHLLVLYTKINESLKEDILLDYIWPLIMYDFEDKSIVVEYFNIMRVIYTRNVRDQLKYFGFIDIVRFMLKTTEFDGMICCEQHNKEQQVIHPYTSIKIDQFGLFIQNLFALIVQELNSTNSDELQTLFAISIHQLLSYCTKDHNPCQMQTLLIVILGQIMSVNPETIIKVFSNFEAVSFAVLLYNSTEFYVLKVYCIKLFQAITEKNGQFYQKLILSLIPPQKSKSVSWLGCEPLINSILEWALAIDISAKITEYQMFDEKLVFKNNEVLELILCYLYLCPDMMKQQLVTTLYTLIRNNKENQRFFLNHKHFLSTFPKFLLTQQDQILLNNAEENSINKSVLLSNNQIFDTSIKLITTIFSYQMNNGRVELLFQWQKLVQLEQMKQKNEDQDGCKHPKTPQFLLRQLFNNIFINVLKSSILNCSELQNEPMWKGFNLLMASFLALIAKELIQFDQAFFLNIGKAKYTPQIFIFRQLMNSNNDPWIEYQFMIKIISIINFLYSQTLQMNLDITKPGIGFRTNDFVIWLHYLFQRITGGERDNICLLRIIQTLVSYYQHYIVTLHFGQEQLEESIQLLKAYTNLMQAIVCGSQQLKNLKQIAVDIEMFIIQSHYYFIESQMKLINQIRIKCSKDHRSSHDVFFNLIQEKYTLQELITVIQFQLTEYYSSCVRLCQIYGKRSQNYLWTFCYEIIRMKKQEGEIFESYLQTLINQTEIISDIVISKEMVNYYCNSPNIINEKAKSQLKISELIRWAELLIQQQEHEQVVQYQEQYSRQSQILMKDVTQTLNKYNLIQLQNYEIFESEKLKYDQSKTL